MEPMQVEFLLLAEELKRQYPGSVVPLAMFCFWFRKIIIYEIQNIIGRTNSLSTCLLVPFVALKLLLKNISKCILKISMTIVSSIVISVRRPALEGGS